jgi:hypothetical protein
MLPKGNADAVEAVTGIGPRLRDGRRHPVRTRAPGARDPAPDRSGAAAVHRMFELTGVADALPFERGCAA